MLFCRHIMTGPEHGGAAGGGKLDFTVLLGGPVPVRRLARRQPSALPPAAARPGTAGGGAGRRRGRGADVLMGVAGVHDDAGAFPGFDEPPPGVRAVELQHQVVQIGRLGQQTGRVGVHFFPARAAGGLEAGRGGGLTSRPVPSTGWRVGLLKGRVRPTTGRVHLTVVRGDSTLVGAHLSSIGVD